MELGSIFKKKFNVELSNLSLMDINKIAIKKISFRTYAESIVSKRGNIFKNKSYPNVSQYFNDKLNSYT